MRKLVNFVVVRSKKVPFYSLFCWIKRRQFFKALKIKAYLWHISCFVLPKLCDGRKRAPQNAFSLNAALLCVSLYPILYDKSIIRFGVMIQSFCPTNGSCVGQFFYLFVSYQIANYEGMKKDIEIRFLKMQQAWLIQANTKHAYELEAL